MQHSPGFLKIVDEARARVREVTIDALRERMRANPALVLLDVREESEWAAGREQLRALLEDAWVHPMVQRRWAELMQALTGAQCARIVRRAMERDLAAGRARWLEPERAVEGWGA